MFVFDLAAWLVFVWALGRKYNFELLIINFELPWKGRFAKVVESEIATSLRSSQWQYWRSLPKACRDKLTFHVVNSTNAPLTVVLLGVCVWAVRIGKGLDVIWTCRSDHLGDSHFDTRQYNHIEWESPGELRDKLRDRILATIQWCGVRGGR